MRRVILLTVMAQAFLGCSSATRLATPWAASLSDCRERSTLRSEPDVVQPKPLTAPRIDSPSVRDEVGFVCAEVLVLEDGRVGEVTIIGTNNPSLALEFGEVLRGTRFHPATREGAPIEARTSLTYQRQ
jgi:hypothetical protein